MTQSLLAAVERVRHLEEAGIIVDYAAQIDFKKLGYPTTIFIELSIPPNRYKKVILLQRNQQGQTTSIIALSKTVSKNGIDLI